MKTGTLRPSQGKKASPGARNRSPSSPKVPSQEVSQPAPSQIPPPSQICQIPGFLAPPAESQESQDPRIPASPQTIIRQKARICQILEKSSISQIPGLFQLSQLTEVPSYFCTQTSQFRTKPQDPQILLTKSLPSEICFPHSDHFSALTPHTSQNLREFLESLQNFLPAAKFISLTGIIFADANYFPPHSPSQ